MTQQQRPFALCEAVAALVYVFDELWVALSSLPADTNRDALAELWQHCWRLLKQLPDVAGALNENEREEWIKRSKMFVGSAMEELREGWRA